MGAGGDRCIVMHLGKESDPLPGFSPFHTVDHTNRSLAITFFFTQLGLFAVNQKKTSTRR